MKRTKIVATIGPATNKYAELKKLGQAGVNIFRLNFSHGSHEIHKEVIDQVRKLNQDTGENYALMIDTKGPEIRTSDLEAPLNLKKNQEITLTIDDVTYETHQKIKINYPGFIKDVTPGQVILIDNGVMNFKVLEVKGSDVLCKVLDGGELTGRRHVNLPGQDISLESITEKDWKDIAFAVEQKVDFLALSFIRSAKDIQQIKDFLQKHNSDIQVITKVETLRATQRIDELFEVSDGIMVARGDLGAEIPFEKVPIVQWEIAQKGALYKKPVIVATHMMESMIEDPIPTRAEITDVFSAVWQKNDAIMLSGETSVGKYPIKCVEAMDRIARETEKTYLKERSIRTIHPHTDKEGFCKNASDMAEDIESVNSIIVITRSGQTAKLLASFRPQVPIHAFTENPGVCRKMSLLWGTQGYVLKLEKDPEKTIQKAIELLLTRYPKLKGKKCVILSNILVDQKMTEALQVRILKESLIN